MSRGAVYGLGEQGRLGKGQAAGCGGANRCRGGCSFQGEDCRQPGFSAARERIVPFMGAEGLDRMVSTCEALAAAPRGRLRHPRGPQALTPFPARRRGAVPSLRAGGAVKRLGKQACQGLVPRTA